jgi:hypothetical protein
MRRRLSTPGWGSGCRLAVERSALDAPGARSAHGDAEHPLGVAEVPPGAGRPEYHDRVMPPQGAGAGWLIGAAVLRAAPGDVAAVTADCVGCAWRVVPSGDRAGVMLVSAVRLSQRTDHAMPVRALIDRPSTGLRRVTACATSRRREGRASCGPSHGQAPTALSGRRPRPARPHQPRHRKDDE